MITTANREKASEFWAKTGTNGTPGIPVSEHMMNVGHVASNMLASSPPLLELSQMHCKTLEATGVLHGLRKISPGLERDSDELLEEINLAHIAVGCEWEQKAGPDVENATDGGLQDSLRHRGCQACLGETQRTLRGTHRPGAEGNASAAISLG